jgi:putative ABC transport system substrate-binding protein
MQRREFIALLGGAAAAWPLAARTQQRPAMPVVAFISNSTAEASARYLAAFRKGLSESGNAEGQNATVEYYWLEGRYDRLPALVADLARRRVAVIATPGLTPAALAAKAATATIPIVFGVGDDPVKLGLVASLARPGGNATGTNWFGLEVISKRLGLLHQLVPKAARIAVLVNPGNALAAESTLKRVLEVAPTLGLEVHGVNVSTIDEINVAFTDFERERVDALFVGNNGFFAPPCPICNVVGALPVAHELWAARVCRSRRADELRDPRCGHVSSDRHLYWCDPQGRQARRPSSRAAHQV